MKEAINLPLIDGRIGCRKLVAADKDDVEEMVTKYFCPNEPLRSALEVVYPGKVDTEFVRKHAEECMSCNSSLMAYNIQTGETAGIILCEVLRYKDDQTMDDEKWKAKFRNIGVTTINAKLFETLNKNLGKVTEGKMCFRIYLATVNPSYGRLGIMSGLVERIELVAKDLGCDFIFMESTSLYTQRIASKLGYTTENEIKYSGYFDPLSGTYIFKHIPAPHQSVKLLVKAIT